eukprot:4695178-Prymnesium_polylepis.1
MRLDNGNVIGGYNPTPWGAGEEYSTTPAILFSITRDQVYEQVARYEDAVVRAASHGPTFGAGND